MKLGEIYTNIIEVTNNLNLLGVLLEREIKVGDNLNKKLSSVNNSLSKKMLNFLTSDKIKDVNVDYVDYNPENEKLLTLGYKDAKGNNRVRNVKILKLLSYLGADISDIKSYEVEELISYFKKGETSNFKIVSGPDILKVYYCENYDEGETMGSCMRSKTAQSYLTIYVNNPNQIKCLVLFNPENNKVRGRALLWKLDDGSTFIDRIYVTNNEYKKDFNAYISEKSLNNGTPTDEVTLENGGDYDEYPYMDTFMYYTPSKNLLSSISGDIELQDTNGGDSTGIWSEHYERNIPQDDAAYVEHISDYVYWDDVVMSWNEDEYLFYGSDDVKQIEKGEYKGSYALVEDLVEDYKGEMVLNDYAYIIEKGGYVDNYAITDEITHDYEDVVILVDEAISIDDGEFTGSYAIEGEIIADYKGDTILKSEAVLCTYGTNENDYILKVEAFVFTVGENKGLVFHESDEERFGDFEDTFVHYTHINESTINKKMGLHKIFEEIIMEGFDGKIRFKQNIGLMIDILPDGARLKKYYEWLYNKTNMVNVVPLTDSGININRLKVSENDCFVNSILLSSKIKGSKFVFGFAVNETGDVASHGWVKMGGRYHDPTYEKFYTINNITYLKLGELDPNKAKSLNIFKIGPQSNFANDTIFIEDFENGKLI